MVSTPFAVDCGRFVANNIAPSIYLSGAFFGTTFPHLFFQSYRELMPAPFYKPSSRQSNSPHSSGSVSPAQVVEDEQEGGGEA